MLFKKEKSNEKVDIEKLNDVITLSDKILKIFYVLITIIAIYIGLKLCKELRIFDFTITILKVITPFFIGLFIAWLLDPFITFLQRKGMRRGLGIFVIYFLFIVILGVIVGAIIPILSDQITELAKFIPTFFDTIKEWINGAFDALNRIDGIDGIGIKNDVFNKIEEIGLGIASSIPETLMNLGKSVFSGASNIIIGMIVGFYLLLTFNDVGDSIVTILPKKIQRDTRDLFNDVNTSLRKFIQGSLIDCTLVFIVASIAFGVIGLQSPLIFGLFCGITNIIPYAGPYIGGAPAVLVAFSQGPLTGVLTLVAIAIIQFLEGNLLQPIVMSKTTKLHPVTVMIGLLVFGHFFGIFGMVIATPAIAVFKAILLFFNEKYEIIDFD